MFVRAHLSEVCLLAGCKAMLFNRMPARQESGWCIPKTSLAMAQTQYELCDWGSLRCQMQAHNPTSLAAGPSETGDTRAKGMMDVRLST